MSVLLRVREILRSLFGVSAQRTVTGKKNGERKCQLQSCGEVCVNARIRLLGRKC
jgi:hypothetical protein